MSYLTGESPHRVALSQISKHWWVTAAVSYLTGGSPQRVVPIEIRIRGSRQLCRILRVGRRSGWLVLKSTSVGRGCCVVSYRWVAAAGGSY